MSNHSLIVKNLTKVFHTGHGDVRAVDGVSFELKGSTFFTMLGPSGCGKTTTLRMIAGLESISSGAVTFDGRDMIAIDPLHRNIGMVFQSYALFPHMTVFMNTAYGLDVRRTPKNEVERRVKRALEVVGLTDLAHRHPADLSGGQQQRVSIARALVYEPSLLLLDEPLANLDAKLRVEMREEIRRLQKELGIMTIYVTHDQEEAMSISDRLAVFSAGQLMQVGSPDAVYNEPSSLFVAQFIGKANMFRGHAMPIGQERSEIRLPSGIAMTGKTVVDDSAEFQRWAFPAEDGVLMVRPACSRIVGADEGAIPGTIRRIQFLGSCFRYLLSCPDAVGEIVVDSPRAIPGLAEGQAAGIAADSDDITIYVASNGART